MIVERLWAPSIQRLVARNWNCASSGCALIRSSVPNIGSVSTPLRIVVSCRSLGALFVAAGGGGEGPLGPRPAANPPPTQSAARMWGGESTVLPVHAAPFCTAPDGVGLAYAIDGDGPPLVKAANWMTHLDYDRQSPVWRHWVRS